MLPALGARALSGARRAACVMVGSAIHLRAARPAHQWAAHWARVAQPAVAWAIPLAVYAAQAPGPARTAAREGRLHSPAQWSACAAARCGRAAWPRPPLARVGAAGGAWGVRAVPGPIAPPARQAGAGPATRRKRTAPAHPPVARRDRPAAHRGAWHQAAPPAGASRRTWAAQAAQRTDQIAVDVRRRVPVSWRLPPLPSVSHRRKIARM